MSVQAAWQELPPEKYSWLLEGAGREDGIQYPNAASLVQPSDAAKRADKKAADSRKRAGGENAPSGGSKRAAGTGTVRGSVPPDVGRVSWGEDNLAKGEAYYHTKRSKAEAKQREQQQQ
jgi:hypothetical protein